MDYYPPLATDYQEQSQDQQPFPDIFAPSRYAVPHHHYEPAAPYQASSSQSSPAAYNDLYKLASPNAFPAHGFHRQSYQDDYGLQYTPQTSFGAFSSPSRYSQPFPAAASAFDHHFDDLSLRPLSGGAAAQDLPSFMRPFLEQYIHTPNRLAFGERTVIVMSSKVAQKSYGTEKRFLCPPPTAVLIGNSWWSTAAPPSAADPEPRMAPPRVVVSISGEPAPPADGSVEWTTAAGKSFDVQDPPGGTTYVGRCVGKQLFISDVDEKKKKVEALVRVISTAWVDDGAPGTGTPPREDERIVGTFASRPIKVISKPSKKRQSAKNLELCINHGSTISLFHRLRSQTVSTKYLCVSGSGSSFKGSDGAPLSGLDQRARAGTPSFIARTASWDPFILYIVDPSLPPHHAHLSDPPPPPPPPPPPHPDYPSPPPNAIPFTNNGSQIPIYYNQTVVLQCLTSGVVSPVLIIRKVDHQTTVVGGGSQTAAASSGGNPTSPTSRTPNGTANGGGGGGVGPADSYCPAGEVCGDPVSQLHKVAFEVWDPSKHARSQGQQQQQLQTTTLGESGAFLSCMGEKVNTYRPVDGRQWNANAGNGVNGAPPATPSTTMASPTSEYFPGSANGDSAPGSPSSSNDGGRVRKKRSTSSAGNSAPAPKGRRRPSSASSAGSSSGRGSAAGSDGGRGGSGNGAVWSVDIGETSVWTIVGTDQVRYNFYVPPVLFDSPAAPASTALGSFPVPAKPVTPFPAVVKYLPPDRAAEVPKHHHHHHHGHHDAFGSSSSSALGGRGVNPAKLLTVYGENFNKAEPVSVFFGADPSPFVEVRCTEVLGCLPPENQGQGVGGGKRKPIMLVRNDGVVFPSNVMYP